MAEQSLGDLASLLVLRGVLTGGSARQVARRLQMYGGGMDTVLLEMNLVAEADLRRYVGQATGLQAATDECLVTPDAEVSLLLDVQSAKRFGAVVVRQAGDTIEMVGRPSVDADAAQSWANARGFALSLLVATEVRFWGLLAEIYREPIPPRFFALLTKLMGPTQGRRWVGLQAGPRRAVEPKADTGPLPFRPDVPRGAPIDVQELDDDVLSFDEEADDVAENVPQQAQAPIVELVTVFGARPGDDVLPGSKGGGYFTLDGQDIDLLLEIYELEPESTAGRTAAAKVLQRTAPDGLLARLPDRIRRRPDAERALLRLLAGYGPRIARTLTPLLEHPDPQWRRWAVGIFEFTEVAGPEAMLCRMVDGDDELLRRSALRALRRRLDQENVAALAESLRAEALSDDVPRARRAIAALAELRDPGAVPLLTTALRHSQARIAMAAHAALVDITKQDFGSSRWRWNNWSRQFGHRSRIEWLLEALGHKSPELRLAASVELRDLTGEYMGYHFDLSRRDREEAQQRWWTWWDNSGRQRFGAGTAT